MNRDRYASGIPCPQCGTRNHRLLDTDGHGLLCVCDDCHREFVVRL